ncbi:hypothetical protein Tco_0868402 [Tanacetum coccineum]
MVQKKISLTNVKANKLLMSVQVSSKYSTSFQSYRRKTQNLVAEKTDFSENRASRNFDLMIITWCLLKITLQAPFLNVQMTFDHSSSSLDRQCQMASTENNTSGPVPQCLNDV